MVARSDGQTLMNKSSKPALSWKLEIPHAPWQARDSQGELVFNDRLWIMGGWFDSHSSPPRDVWSSPDGKTWELVTDAAPWKHSDFPMVLTFQNKMWLMGGWYNGRLPDHSASSEVWSSSDGKEWHQVTEHAGWTPRLAGVLVEFKGRMWIFGGIEDYYFGNQASLKNDVWSSADGKNWTCETPDAGWAPRAYHQAAVLDGKIYVFGGGNYTPTYQAFNDVWSSEDGKTWRCETDHAPWIERIWFGSVVYRDRIWILGGWTKEGDNPRNLSGVWFSQDGRQWTQLSTETTWKERHEHAVFVFQDKLWLAAGHAQPLSNEVWSLHIPHDYFDDE